MIRERGGVWENKRRGFVCTWLEVKLDKKGFFDVWVVFGRYFLEFVIF